MQKPTEWIIQIMTVPGQVALWLTATLALKPAAQAAPYPPSQCIPGVIWDHPSTIVRHASGSDNWPTTWGPDGHVYTSWGDGNGFGNERKGLGIARLEGDPGTFKGLNLWGVNEGGYWGGKSYGLLSVQGILFMWFGPEAQWKSSTETRLGWSADLGKSWDFSEVFFRHPDGVSLPSFLNFGRDYAGARDDYVYSYACDASNGAGGSWTISSGPWTNITLIRALKTQMTNRTAYEFYRGRDSAGCPCWTDNAAKRTAVFSNPHGGVQLPSACYHPATKRYLLIVPNGTPTRPYGGLGICDAPEPWGPWTTVYHTNSFLGSTNLFYANIPTKWISDDGAVIYLVFTGYGSDPVAQDAYQHIRGVLR
ncbi:MAG TPA: hypothetical protein P5186_16735 [Candidatus Paceibacterota bacterium]|nr:hypothetical protein [Verrucomicrobiota bacterium]HRY49697.1 hypothetical protein [Candidatus Paceibacterota bacterium]